MNLKIAAALLIIGLGASMTAQAQQAGRSVAPSRIVKFGDLDLATTTGRRELQTRIAKAALEVCRAAVRARQDVILASCYSSARRKALEKVN